MKRIGYGVASIVLAIVMCFSSISSELNTVEAATAMKVESISGKVTLKNSKNKTKTIKNGTRLLSGDNLTTAAKAKANILLDATKAALVEESSAVTVQQKGKDLDLVVDKGSVFFDVSKKLTSKESFEIKTSNMVCGIRGTIGEVKTVVDKKNKTTKSYIYLLEGQVKVTYNATAKKKKTKTIKAGQKLTVSTNNKTGKSSIKTAAVTVNDITLPVFEKIKVNETLLKRVEAATPSIEWTKDIDEAIKNADTSSGVTVDTSSVKAPRVSGSIYNRDVDVTYTTLYFGNYWQEDTNGDGKVDKTDAKQPIRWRVLSFDGENALLFADKVLDGYVYNNNDIDGNTAWAGSSIRKWLNTEFMDEAFSDSEKLDIKYTSLKNTDNTFTGAVGGEDTVDMVFLLSQEDMANKDYGFTGYNPLIGNSSIIGQKNSVDIHDFALIRETTGYANRFEWAGQDIFSGKTTQRYWLRTPGYSAQKSGTKMIVSDTGRVNNDLGNSVATSTQGIVPAIRINLAKSKNWAMSYSSYTISPDLDPLPEPTYDSGSSGNNGNNDPANNNQGGQNNGTPDGSQNDPSNTPGNAGQGRGQGG